MIELAIALALLGGLGGLFWRLGTALGLIIVTQGFRGLFIRDGSDGKARSGLMVLRDHGTGREYLMSPTGHLTPRLEEDHGQAS